MLSYDCWWEHQHIYANAHQHELEILVTNIQGDTKYFTKPTVPKRMQKDFNEAVEVLQKITDLHKDLLENGFSKIDESEYNKKWDKFWAKLKE